jgi:two-component system chemotaxis response regulator CheB
MDYEMPVMDGITAVRHIMESNPTPVLMFSSLTHEGARVTLDALEAGAVDFLPKNFEDISRDSSKLQEVLKKRILEVARSRPKAAGSSATAVGTATPTETRGSPAANNPATVDRVPRSPIPSVRTDTTKPKRDTTLKPKEPAVARTGKIKPAAYACVLIGTSTGGPIALQKVLTRLPANFAAPIILVQHMPASFTPAFAERLNKLCQIEVREAKDGDSLQKGVALLAPGGTQMMIENRGGAKVRIIVGDERLNYKPCVDVTFGSAAKVFPGKTLGIILTGMGADGKEGCRMMKQTGSAIWAQDEKTSVIYGMPMAVAKAGLADEILALEEVADNLISGVI